MGHLFACRPAQSAVGLWTMAQAVSPPDQMGLVCMQVCTIGFGLVDKGPWLQKSHDLVMLAGGRTLRPTSEGYLRTEQGPRLRHIHLLDVDSHLQGIRHSMTWDTLSPHCGPVASAMLPLLLWPVSLLVTLLVSIYPSPC